VGKDVKVFDQKKRVKGGYNFIQDRRLRWKVASFTRSVEKEVSSFVQ
jgi:hypothetical protein